MHSLGDHRALYTVTSASVAVKMLSFLCPRLNPETGFLHMIHKSTLFLLRGSYSAVIHSRIYVSSCYSGFQALERMLIECSKHVETLELKGARAHVLILNNFSALSCLGPYSFLYLYSTLQNIVNLKFMHTSKLWILQKKNAEHIIKKKTQGKSMLIWLFTGHCFKLWSRFRTSYMLSFEVRHCFLSLLTSYFFEKKLQWLPHVDISVATLCV